MALLFLFILICIGLILVFFIRTFEDNNKVNMVSEISFKLSVYYAFGLIVATIGCVIYGLFTWLKNGIWNTVSLKQLVFNLSPNNNFRDLILHNSSWVGINEISSWYLQQNIGWTFMIALVVMTLMLIFTSD